MKSETICSLAPCGAAVTGGAIAVDAAAEAGPIVVDVDGTLLRTDLLYESLVLLLCHRPWYLFLLPVWLLAGKAALKRQIARHVQPDIASLPLHEELLAWLRAERERGRRLALFSASDEWLVARVAERCGGLFDVVAGSDGRTNLAGTAKLAAIKARLGACFTYAGDSRHDLAIWEHCRSAVLVGRTRRLSRLLSPAVELDAVFDVPQAGLKAWIRALRLHQWAKNTLLFVPLLLSGRILNPSDMATVLLAFLVFGLVASGSYLVNDLFDLAADRRHRSKRRRPFASGELPVLHGLLAVPLLACAAGLPLLALPQDFAAATGAYLLITLAYSFQLKRVAILDMLVLALLFTLRIAAGIAVLGTPPAPWLFAFSIFFFLSLTCIKRYSECLVLQAEGRTAVAGRGYRAGDAPWLMAMGAGSGFCSMLVFCLYLVDATSPVRHYAHPEWMWLIGMILLYWLSHVWLLAVRGEMHDDPVLFAVKDRLSLGLGALAVLVVLRAFIL